VAWSGLRGKIITIHPVLISGIVSLTVDHSNFTQRNATTPIYTEIWNSVVVEFCAVLTSVTNSCDIGSF